VSDRRSLPVAVRIAALATTVLAFALLVGGVLFSRALQNTTRQSLDESAQERLSALTALVEQDRIPQQLPESRDSLLFAQVVGPTGKIVGYTRNVSDMQAMVDTEILTGATTSLAVTEGQVDDANCRIFTKVVSTLRGDYKLLVAVPQRVTNDLQHTFQRQLTAVGPLVLALAAIALYLMARRALRPVDRLRSDVDGITATDLAKRVHTPGTNDEVGRLARTMNALLQRLQLSSERQTRFVSDASHELRTPLATSRTRLEVALRRPETNDWPLIGRELLKDNVRMSRLVDDLLFLAKSDNDANGHRRPFHEVDVDEVIHEVVDGLRLTSPIPISTAAVSAGRVLGDSDQIARVVTNLVDNAVRYARSAVSVSLQTHDDRVTLTIADDGPGIAPSERSRVFERFGRTDEARSRTDGGAGLGLAIVKEIVTAHSGSITIDEHYTPGTSMRIVFPAVN
jgi:signal transduction histidine kinase